MSGAVHEVFWFWGLPGVAGKGHPLPVLFPGSTDMSCNAVCGWLLLVMGLEVPRQGQAVNQGRLL